MVHLDFSLDQTEAALIGDNSRKQIDYRYVLYMTYFVCRLQVLRVAPLNMTIKTFYTLCFSGRSCCRENMSTVNILQGTFNMTILTLRHFADLFSKHLLIMLQRNT